MRRSGFTIVELLIVIVIIGILAAITVVAYTGIQQQAATVVLKSDLKNASTQLEIDRMRNGSYPASKEAANGGSGLKASDGTSFEYSLTGSDYCLSASSSRAGSTAFHISSTAGTIDDSVCSGHTAPTGGSGAVENQGIVTTLAGSGNYGWLDGTGATAQFDGPSGVAVDASGTVYVADADNNRIRKITPGGMVTTLAGSAYGYVDGTGAAAQFNYPTGVAVDASGTVYVADHSNNRIRKITPGGVVTTLAGSAYGYADGTGAAAQFNYPSGVAVDASGTVYVADRSNHRIRKITPSGEVTTFAGSTQGYADGTGTAAQFNYPSGVAVDASGTVYVADNWNHRIRKITPGGVVTTLAGSTEGYADGTGAAAQFNYPTGVAVDASGTVYVADNSNNRIRKITPGGVVTTLAGSTNGYADGTGTVAQFDFNYLSGVAVDASSTVYVADQSNSRIRKIQ